MAYKSRLSTLFLSLAFLTTAALPAEETVKLAANNTLGVYLVNQTGFTLYYSLKDAPGNGTSTCYANCSQIWRPFYLENITTDRGLKNADFTIIYRADGIPQIVYKGWPLYLYSKDIKPKDAYGQNVDNVWSVIDPTSSSFRHRVAPQSSEKSAIINLMIDAQAFSSQDPAFNSERSLEAITNLIIEKNLTATIFSAQDVLNSELDLDITRLGLDPRFELAMSGNNTGEEISHLSYEEQKASLERSKKWVEAAKICGVNEIIVYGFMPQSFDQNTDTYKVLDELKIHYDAGFQTGLIYEHGHESDVWPYLVEGHGFYAVPVSNCTIWDKKTPLSDRSFKDSGLDAGQWYEALTTKFDQIQGKNETLVISLTTSVSGSGDFLDALKEFIRYVLKRDAEFVTTAQLVELSRRGMGDVSELARVIDASSNCVNCSQSEVMQATAANPSL